MNSDPAFTIVQSPRGLILFCILLAAIFVGCGEQRVNLIPNGKKQPISVNAISLARVSETVKTATYFGELVPNRTLSLAFNESGKIAFVAQAGTNVAANERLAELDVAELEDQKQSFQERLSQTANEQEFQQTRELIEALDARIQLSRISAPFDCVVDDVFVFENSLVRERVPVLRIHEAEAPKIEINLPSRFARFIDADLSILFVLDDKAIVGKLAQKSKVTTAGSVKCQFDIDSDLNDVDFRFGQTIEARFNFKVDNSGYWIPLSALQRSSSGVWSLFAIETENEKRVVERKLVSVVQLGDDQALVEGKLSDGTLVIADGTHRVVPGQEVIPRLVSNSASAKEETVE